MTTLLTPLRSLSLLVAVGALSMLAGCDLYFGNHGGNGDTWTYCGSDGFYQCSGDNCEWVSSTCPVGSGSGGGSGYQCGANTDCAAGCYCTASGTCEEGGFCASDADCGPGYTCDTSRSSCEPTPPTPTCASNADCTGAGQFCDATTNTCQTGACASASTITATCTTVAPVCATGQSPVAFNGCFTGTCEDTAACSPAAGCKYINDETLCTANTTCQASYTGLNCHDAGNNACHSGQSGCTCESFVFAACADAPH